jgi:hypothetical protein
MERPDAEATVFVARASDWPSEWTTGTELDFDLPGRASLRAPLGTVARAGEPVAQ